MLLSCDRNRVIESTHNISTSEKRPIYNIDINSPYWILYDKAYYVVLDTKSSNKKYIKVLNQSFQVINEIGEVGYGPNELDIIPGYVPQKKFLTSSGFELLAGFSLIRFQGFDKSDGVSLEKLEYPRDYHMPPQHHVVANDSLLWINGGSSLNRFFIYNLNTKEIIHEIAHLDQAKGFDDEKLMYEFNAHGVFDEINQQVIWVYNTLNLIEIYKPTGELIRELFLEGNLFPKEGSGLQMSRATFFNPIALNDGFIVACRDPKVYDKILDMRRTGQSIDKNSDQLFIWLLVFDKSGNQLGEIKIPNFSGGFCINEDQDIMVFSSNFTEDYPFFTLPIPELIKEIM
jgi:hypothetical protein